MTENYYKYKYFEIQKKRIMLVDRYEILAIVFGYSVFRKTKVTADNYQAKINIGGDFYPFRKIISDYPLYKKTCKGLVFFDKLIGLLIASFSGYAAYLIANVLLRTSIETELFLTELFSVTVSVSEIV